MLLCLSVVLLLLPCLSFSISWRYCSCIYPPCIAILTLTYSLCMLYVVLCVLFVVGFWVSFFSASWLVCYTRFFILHIYHSTAAPDDPDPDPQSKSDDLPNVQGSVYVPPGTREGAEGGGRGGGAYVPPGMRGSGRGNRLPPDLNSAVAFPSLQGVAKKGEGRWVLEYMTCLCVSI